MLRVFPIRPTLVPLHLPLIASGLDEVRDLGLHLRTVLSVVFPFGIQLRSDTVPCTVSPLVTIPSRGPLVPPFLLSIEICRFSLTFSRNSAYDLFCDFHFQKLDLTISMQIVFVYPLPLHPKFPKTMSQSIPVRTSFSILHLS